MKEILRSAPKGHVLCLGSCPSLPQSFIEICGEVGGENNLQKNITGLSGVNKHIKIRRIWRLDTNDKALHYNTLPSSAPGIIIRVLEKAFIQHMQETSLSFLMQNVHTPHIYCRPRVSVSLRALFSCKHFHFFSFSRVWGCRAEEGIWCLSNTQVLWEAGGRSVEGCPTPATWASLGLWSWMTCLFGLAECMSLAPGPISESAVRTQSAAVEAAAKTSNSNCQTALGGEARLFTVN